MNWSRKKEKSGRGIFGAIERSTDLCSAGRGVRVFLLHEISDAVIIGVVVLVNAVVGVIQEGKAQKALESLKKLTSPRAVVRRDSVVREIAAAELVVGDVVILETGSQVPADLRLVQAWNLKIEESALTGESVPVEKTSEKPEVEKTAVGERKNEAFMSTLVTAGRGEGIVTATGMQSEIGKVASMIRAVPREYTPLQKNLPNWGNCSVSFPSCFVCCCSGLRSCKSGM